MTTINFDFVAFLTPFVQASGVWLLGAGGWVLLKVSPRLTKLFGANAAKIITDHALTIWERGIAAAQAEAGKAIGDLTADDLAHGQAYILARYGDFLKAHSLGPEEVMDSLKVTLAAQGVPVTAGAPAAPVAPSADAVKADALAKVLAAVQSQIDSVLAPSQMSPPAGLPGPLPGSVVPVAAKA